VSRPVRVAVLLVAATATLALGGCRGAAATAAGGGGGAASADPLGSIESSIAAVEKQVDRDGTG